MQESCWPKRPAELSDHTVEVIVFVVREAEAP